MIVSRRGYSSRRLRRQLRAGFCAPLQVSHGPKNRSHVNGHPRFTADLDLVLDPDETNTLAAIPTLESLDDQARAPVPLRDFAKNQKRRAWMKLTPAQRLAWLEEAKRFAELVKRSRQVTEEECQTEH